MAELHQTWTAQEAPRSRRSRFGDDDQPEPDELINESLTLDFWVDALADARRLARDPAAADTLASRMRVAAPWLADEGLFRAIQVGNSNPALMRSLGDVIWQQPNLKSETSIHEGSGDPNADKQAVLASR